MKRFFKINNIVVVSHLIGEIQSVENDYMLVKTGIGKFINVLPYSIDHIQGLPLNETFLMSCGFVKFSNSQSTCHLYKDGNDVILVRLGINYFILDQDFLDIKINHLHELQNNYYKLKGFGININYEHFTKLFSSHLMEKN